MFLFCHANFELLTPILITLFRLYFYVVPKREKNVLNFISFSASFLLEIWDPWMVLSEKPGEIIIATSLNRGKREEEEKDAWKRRTSFGTRENSSWQKGASTTLHWQLMGRNLIAWKLKESHTISVTRKATLLGKL